MPQWFGGSERCGTSADRRHRRLLSVTNNSKEKKLKFVLPGILDYYSIVLFSFFRTWWFAFWKKLQATYSSHSKLLYRATSCLYMTGRNCATWKVVSERTLKNAELLFSLSELSPRQSLYSCSVFGRQWLWCNERKLLYSFIIIIIIFLFQAAYPGKTAWRLC